MPSWRDEGDRRAIGDRLVATVNETLLMAMGATTPSQMSRTLCGHPGAVTILPGRGKMPNMTLRTVAAVADALNLDVEFTVKPR